MKYISTRGGTSELDFSEAVAQGLGTDGGLFVPREFPQLDINKICSVESFPDFAFEMLTPFLAEDPLQKDLRAMCHAAFAFPIPLRWMKKPASCAVLEVFHGPTAAFKDVGARFLAECAARTQSGTSAASGHHRTVIVATSGDTGGAVAGAFFGRPGIDVIVLFPKGRISPRQEKQITAWGGNVRAIAVLGSFDDCQRLVKEALRDSEVAKQRSFISANSINVGRLLPQVTYLAKAAVDFKKAHGVSPGVIMPTGNLGHGVAALWAKRLGFPIREVVLASNANRAIVDFLQNCQWQPRETITTLANAMDVGNPSNMERLRALYPDFATLKREVRAISVSDAEISQTIVESFRETGDIWCPHTATAVFARQTFGGENWILVATAHPAKFEGIVEPLIGQTIPVPESLAKLLDRPAQFQTIAARLEDLCAALKFVRN